MENYLAQNDFHVQLLLIFLKELDSNWFRSILGLFKMHTRGYVRLSIAVIVCKTRICFVSFHFGKKVQGAFLPETKT